MEVDDSPVQNIMPARSYQDDVVRVGEDGKTAAGSRPSRFIAGPSCAARSVPDLSEAD